MTLGVVKCYIDFPNVISDIKYLKKPVVNVTVKQEQE